VLRAAVPLSSKRRVLDVLAQITTGADGQSVAVAYRSSGVTNKPPAARCAANRPPRQSASASELGTAKVSSLLGSPNVGHPVANSEACDL
jgi:hypothetical protein